MTEQELLDKQGYRLTLGKLDAKSQFISATCVTATELVVYIHGHY